MIERVGIYSEPFVAVTPLYAFSADSDELSIGENFRLVRYQPDLPLGLPDDDILLKHLRLYQPDYLLWQRTPLEKDDLRKVFDPTSYREEGDDLDSFKLLATVATLFFFPATNLFRLLRLFKPGRLVAGDTFVISCETRPEGLWETAFHHRCSEMVIDYGQLRREAGSYVLSCPEVPFFNVFSDSLLPVLQSLQEPVPSVPPLEVALLLYGRDERQVDLAVLNSLTAFEALLTNESNAELSYRLSLRVANLLESDDASRMKTFKDMKEFYDLRSKTIHGSASLSSKLQARLQQLDLLRELLRRTILSVMALSIDQKSIKIQLDELLDEIVFDQEKRMEVQKIAAKFLHVAAAPVNTVH